MSAREQLLGAVASLREQGPLRIDVLKHRTTPRESAVLILVGVLDDVAAESDGPLTIIVSGEISGSAKIRVAADKTIYGEAGSCKSLSAR